MRQELAKSLSFKIEKPDFKIENILSKRNVKIAAFVLSLIAAGVIAYKVLDRDTPNQYGDGPDTTNPPVEQQVNTPESNSVVSTETNGEQQSETTERVPKVEDLEVTDLSLIEKPEELVKTFLKLQEDWINSGATRENAQKSIDSNYNLEEYATSIIAPAYDAAYEKALFSEDKLNDPNSNIKQVIDSIEQKHSAILTNNFMTTNPEKYPDMHPEDKEPYRVWIELLSISDGSHIANNQDDKTITSKYRYILHDNSSQNRIGGLEKGVSGQPTDVLSTSFKIIDGKIKITGTSLHYLLNNQ